MYMRAILWRLEIILLEDKQHIFDLSSSKLQFPAFPAKPAMISTHITYLLPESALVTFYSG